MSMPELPRPKVPSFDRVLRDYDNPQSLIHLVSPEVSKMITELPETSCDLTEEELETKFPDPTPTVEQVRRLFWLEYDRALENRMKMDMSRCYIGACSRTGFYKIIKEEKNLAWIITPPKDYLVVTEEILAIGLRQIREIMKLPLVNAMGFYDTKLAEVKLKAVMMLDMRLKGNYIHRSMQVNHNVNENRNTHEYIEQVVSEDHSKAIDEKIRELEEQIAASESPTRLPRAEAQLEHMQRNSVPQKQIIEDAEFTEVKDK